MPSPPGVPSSSPMGSEPSPSTQLWMQGANQRFDRLEMEVEALKIRQDRFGGSLKKFEEMMHGMNASWALSQSRQVGITQNLDARMVDAFQDVYRQMMELRQMVASQLMGGGSMGPLVPPQARGMPPRCLPLSQERGRVPVGWPRRRRRRRSLRQPPSHGGTPPVCPQSPGRGGGLAPTPLSSAPSAQGQTRAVPPQASLPGGGALPQAPPGPSRGVLAALTLGGRPVGRQAPGASEPRRSRPPRPWWPSLASLARGGPSPSFPPMFRPSSSVMGSTWLLEGILGCSCPRGRGVVKKICPLPSWVWCLCRA